MGDVNHPMYRKFMNFCEMNVVPCCNDCNQWKGNRDSGCDCSRCKGAWGTYALLRSYQGYDSKSEPLTQCLGDFFPT